MKLFSLLLLASTALHAGQTRSWTQGESADFEKGVIRNLALRSDGRLSLSPASRELFDSSSAYLWALVQDSKGNLYTGGAGAKLNRIAPDGKPKLVAEFDALEIHALAIDSRDRVYVATAPDGKIFRVTGNAKPELFYDPKAKYIWAIAFDAAGNLFVATGDQGEIHRVTPDGKGKLFFKTEETHARSLAIDAKGNLIVGTEPGGLVLRLSPAGEGFVLYQMSKKEVTAVAIAPDGAIYAAAVGSRQFTPPPAPPPAPAQAVIVVGPGATPAPRPAANPPAVIAPATITGGSEVFRIDPDGAPRRVWSSAQEVVYTIAFDASAHALLGTGNKGNLYRIESPALSTALLVLPATQLTAFQSGAGGRLYAATGSTGKVYEIGPALAPEGSIESDVFDSGVHSLWGRLTFEADLHGGRFAVSTRSGNLDQPQKNWSPWAPVALTAKSGRVTSPAARFIQWKATFTGGAPELDSIDVAYLPRNLEPRIDDAESTPPNYKFPAPSAPLFPIQASLSLPPFGRRAAASSASSDSTPSMQFAKGFIGARWLASDPNGDALIFTIEIKGAAETQWKLLRDKVAERYLSWDSTAFPDGEYRLRITASDAPGNPPADVLTARFESSPFLIDNTPPKITALTATQSGARLQVKWHAADALNHIARAEYSLDGGDWKLAAPVTRLSDSAELDYDITLDAAPGEHTIAVRVEDDYANQSVEKTVVR